MYLVDHQVVSDMQTNELNHSFKAFTYCSEKMNNIHARRGEGFYTQTFRKFKIYMFFLIIRDMYKMSLKMKKILRQQIMNIFG